MPTTSKSGASAIDRPVYRVFPGGRFIHGAGVAIFHVKSARVVVVEHENRYFLPKGRRDVGEEAGRGAEREGFEETGFRNRLLPLPHRTIQTIPSTPLSTPFHTEPISTTLFPMGRHQQVQYICSWYIAETLPPVLEAELNSSASSSTYQPPTPSPPTQTLAERMALEPEGYEPVSQVRAVMQRDEVDYRAELVSVEEACKRLRGSGMEAVVRDGWERIRERMEMEMETEKMKKEHDGVRGPVI